MNQARYSRPGLNLSSHVASWRNHRLFSASTISTTTRSPVGALEATGKSNMFTFKQVIFVVSVCLASTGGALLAETPNRGKPIDEATIAPWDISILPDGTGLPKGSGTPAQGAPIFAEKCSGCHGENGKGGEANALISDRELIGISAAQKTIKNFWPYSTTVFDFIRRAMPFQMPHSLTDDEVYALTAYILAGNKLIGPDDAMDAQTLPKVKMPYRDNFILRFPDRI
jgi:S-disulfanyl-L-cysteine oxidoreductase SoxD